MNKIENYLEQKLKLLHKKTFLPIAFGFFASIIVGIVVRVFFTAHVLLSEVPTTPRVIIKIALWGITILGPTGYVLAWIGLIKGWFHKSK